jgi:hypothetical protein
MKAKTLTILTIVIFCCSNTAQSGENMKMIAEDSHSTMNRDPGKTTKFNPNDDPDEDGERDNSMETLSGNNSHSGGYGALFFKGSSFKNTSILMMGIRGAWVVNRSFGLGIDLNGLLPVSKYDDVDPEGLSDAILLGGYGGLLLEPVVWSKKLVHVTFPISIGAGWLGYVEDWEDEYYYGGGDLMDNDVFWYIEPGINAEVNVTNYFRIDVGISKRFTQDLSLYNTPSDAFDKLNYSLTLKFGGF